MPGITDTTSTSDPGELAGKVAVVTGSSSGIGRAIALELARAGADVLVHARGNQEGAESTKREICSLGRDGHILFADLAQAAALDRFAEQAWAWRDGIDIWINNAGADVLTGETASMSFDDKLAMLWRVDVLATIRLSRLVGNQMRQANRDRADRKRDSPVILNMGWDQAEHGMAGDSGEMFAASKGSIMAFTKSLAHSLAPDVRVNCLAPGWIKTSWGDDATKYWQERACQESLLQRWGTPEDVASAARFLASPAAGFITGQIIPVNGGFRRAAAD